MANGSSVIVPCTVNARLYCSLERTCGPGPRLGPDRQGRDTVGTVPSGAARRKAGAGHRPPHGTGYMCPRAACLTHRLGEIS
ncbi:hypothetical protein QFZ63_000684 [Streptomyces sp. B3I7]|nr:hypothetical protein [Streptomyces sp. B3I7]